MKNDFSNKKFDPLISKKLVPGPETIKNEEKLWKKKSEKFSNILLNSLARRFGEVVFLLSGVEGPTLSADGPEIKRAGTHLSTVLIRTIS